MLRLCIAVILFLSTIDIGVSNTGLISRCDYLYVEGTKYPKIHADSIRRVDENLLLQYMTISQFKDVLGYHESRGIYNITNRYGFKGKYQFSNYMIRRFAKVTPATFLHNPWIQEKAMRDVCAYYIWYLHKYGYTKYVNKEIDGVTVTMEGLMLGMHYCPLWLKWWLESDGAINRSDGNITIRNYIQRFENKGTVVASRILYCY